MKKKLAPGGRKPGMPPPNLPNPIPMSPLEAQGRMRSQAERAQRLQRAKGRKK